MSWILLLLKNLPALLAAIQSIISIFAVRAAMASHAAFQASAAAGKDLGSETWNWYVAGQGCGGAVLAVSAIAFAFAQPTANRVFAAFAREQASERAALSQILASRDQAASAYLLLAQTEALSPKYQAIVKGN